MNTLHLKLLFSAATLAAFLFVPPKAIASGALTWGFGILALVPWVYRPGRKMVQSKTAKRTLTRILLPFILPSCWGLVGGLELFVYVLVTVAAPAAGYTVLMELGYALGLRRRSWHAFAGSALIGLLIGAALSFLSISSIPRDSRTWGMVLFFPAVCAAFGLVISSIVFWLEPREDGRST